jgi:hypothetical protein
MGDGSDVVHISRAPGELPMPDWSHPEVGIGALKWLLLAVHFIEL